MSNLVVITDLQEGDQGIIHSIEGGSALTSRLAGMGIVTGCHDSASRRSAADWSLFK